MFRASGEGKEGEGVRNINYEMHKSQSIHIPLGKTRFLCIQHHKDLVNPQLCSFLISLLPQLSHPHHLMNSLEGCSL